MSANSSTSLLARTVGWLVAPLLLTLAFALWPRFAFAATITVDGATCTLPDAITAANTDAAMGGCTSGSGADTLLLTARTYSLATGPYHNDSDGMSATPSVTTTIVISGGIAGVIVERSGSAPYRLFDVGETGDLTIQNVTIRYGLTVSGGGIFNRGRLMLVDSQLFSNTAPYGGGGIYNHDRGTVQLANVDLRGNVAGYGGGFASHGTAILTNTRFISNTAEFGGGFSNWHGSESFSETSKAILSNSDFFSNTARLGGGLYATGTFGSAETITELTNVNFIANVARSGGGLLSADNNSMSISNTNFISNSAQFGGAMSINGWYGARVILANSHVVSNIADYGGGISIGDVSPHAPTASISIFDSELRANRATNSGGAIHQSHSLVSIIRSRIINNWAGQTGGALLRFADGLYTTPSQTFIDQSCIVNNTYTAVRNESDVLIDASRNWWGAADGPSGIGAGYGDGVSGRVTFTPFLTSTVLNCPTRVSSKIYLPHVEP
jgi:hypothetical protein